MSRPSCADASRLNRPDCRFAGIPYRIPDADGLGAGLSEVLAVIYLLFNERHLSTAEQAQSHDLVDDAEWLASLLHQDRALWDRRAIADAAGC